MRRGRHGDCRFAAPMASCRAAGHRPRRRRTGPPVETILLKTAADAPCHDRPGHQHRARRGRVIWIEVVEAAAEHGLAALAGSSPRRRRRRLHAGRRRLWLARKHGIGANQVTAIEVVTASGELRPHRLGQRARPVLGAAGRRRWFGDRHCDRVQPLPDSEVYAGILWYPVERAAEVLKAWRAGRTTSLTR